MSQMSNEQDFSTQPPLLYVPKVRLKVGTISHLKSDNMCTGVEYEVRIDHRAKDATRLSNCLLSVCPSKRRDENVMGHLLGGSMDDALDNELITWS